MRRIQHLIVSVSLALALTLPLTLLNSPNSQAATARTAPSTSSAQDLTTGPPFSASLTIDGSFDGATSIQAVDMDGDGDLDVLGAATNPDSGTADVSWWENNDVSGPGTGNGSSWTEHVLESSFTGAADAYAADVDGDNSPDVVAALDGSLIQISENDGLTWAEKTMVTTTFAAEVVLIANMDGDSNRDILGVSFGGIAWWRNNGGNPATWSAGQVIDWFPADTIAVADIDGDTHLDVVSARTGTDNLAWWENDGSGTGWTRRNLNGATTKQVRVAAGDIDGDGDIDILSATDSTYSDVQWFENDGTPADGGWGYHLVDSNFLASDLSTADMNGDGNLDILGASYTGNQITWWSNVAGDGTVWVETVVDTAFGGAASIRAADLSGDGKPDLLGAAATDDDVAWWENTISPPSVISVSPPRHAITGPLTATLGATFDHPLLPTSVTSRTVVVHGMQSGLVTGTLNVAGNTVTFDPNRPFFQGELVHTAVLTQVRNITGTRAIPPISWQFNAGRVISRCVEEFTDIALGLVGVDHSSVAWGDYDQDGDLDVAIIGDTGEEPVSTIYRNDSGGTFTDIAAGLTGVRYGSVAWGDYDNDGDLDLLLSGYIGLGSRVSRLYRNDSGDIFTDITAGLTGVDSGSVAWGDYDNDGDLDILVSGYASATYDPFTGLYRNDGAGVFTEIAAGLAGVERSSVAWGDYDNDGDLDILLTGDSADVGTNPITSLYRNDGADTLTSVPITLTDVHSGDAIWVDYDVDGDLDIFLVGFDSAGDPFTGLYRNDGADTWTEIDAGLPLLDVLGPAAWGDADNDGDPDLLLMGASGGSVINHLYRNDGGGTFTQQDIGLPLFAYGSAAWGDVDGDDDLDLLLSGSNMWGTRITRIYRNNDCDQYPHLTGIAPPQSAITVSQTPLISLTYDHPLSPTTVTSHTMAVYGMQSGLMTGTLNVVGNTALLTPSRPFQQGERVHVIASSGIRDLTGTVPIDAFQWQFDTGQAISRCAGRFVAADLSLTGVLSGTLDWGDYDQDGDLDLLLTGWHEGGPVAQVHRNEGGDTFIDITAPLTGVYHSIAAWGDYDGDGDLDIVIAGETGSGESTHLYRNDGSDTFTAVAAGLIGVSGSRHSGVEWGDVDNDGDLDLLLSGFSGATTITRIYRNDGGGTFVDTESRLTIMGSPAWGDMDNDGRLDFVIEGQTSSGLVWGNIYRNLGRGGGAAWTFDRHSALFGFGVLDGSTDWGDYDNDGDLDLLVSGHTGSVRASRVYRNDGPNSYYWDIIHVASLEGVDDSSTTWGDYDNDGDLDILLSGDTGTHLILRVYRNDGADTFTQVDTDIKVIASGPAAWGDYDGDGDLDFALTGIQYPGDSTRIYRNEDCNAYPQVTAIGPPRHAVTASLATSISVTYDRPLSVTTTTSRTFAVYGMQSGLVTVTRAVQGNAVIVTPDRPFRQGEQVIAVATIGMHGATAATPVQPTQFQFTAEQVVSRCVGGFTQIDSGLTRLHDSAAAWGDYDLDGDLDLFLLGRDTDWINVAQIHRNNGDDTFTNIGAGLPGVRDGAAAWGDVDADGDLDLLYTGDTGSGLITRLYRNDGGDTFVDTGFVLPGVKDSSVAWGDHDGDGRLDILLAGESGSGPIARVYYNRGDLTFTGVDVNAAISGVSGGAAVWGDVNGDDRPDILLSGDSGAGAVAQVTQHDGDSGGDWPAVSSGLLAATDSAAAWGDYDNDGDLDILLSGNTISGTLSRVYRNDGAGAFVDIAAGLQGVEDGSVAWGDYDNDGDLDILLGGRYYDGGHQYITHIYRNDGSDTFVKLNAGLAGATGGTVAWGDYDEDGDLDVLATGWGGQLGHVTRLYRNDDCAAPNVSPLFTSYPITTGVVSQTYTYTITVVDANVSDTLSIVALVLPDWLTLTDHGDSTATLTGTPLAAGTDFVVLRVFDGQEIDYQAFVITTREYQTYTYLPLISRATVPRFDTGDSIQAHSSVVELAD